MPSCCNRFWKSRTGGWNWSLYRVQPGMNIVEGLWKWHKSNVINNVFYHTVADIRRNVGQFMNHIMQCPESCIDCLCIKL